MYFFALDSPNPVYLNVRSPLYEKESSKPKPNPESEAASPLSLLLVNKQVADEAFPVLLGTRTFVVTNTPFEPDLSVTESLMAIGTPKLGLIRKMTFEINYCCTDHTGKWPVVFREILAALPAGRKLDLLKVIITDEMKPSVDDTSYSDHWVDGLFQLLQPLKDWKTVKKVVFYGDLYQDYCGSLERYIMGIENSVVDEDTE